MARLHSKKKGKSGTKRPKSHTAPKWVSMKKEEISEIILKLAREGVPAAKIGLILRDQYGVPNLSAILGMPVGAYLTKEKLAPEYPEDLLTLIKKAVRMSAHLKSGKNDTHNKVKLVHVESKIQRLVRYYAKKGRIPGDWKYDRDKAVLLVK
jgi:small subunit ribosomal protein S15